MRFVWISEFLKIINYFIFSILQIQEIKLILILILEILK